jgi:hypothetical protein
VPNKKICRDQIPEEEVEAMQRGGLEENKLLLTAETAPQLDSHVFCLPILHHNQPEPNTHALLLLLSSSSFYFSSSSSIANLTSINNILPPRPLNPTPRPIHHPHLLLPSRLILPLDQIPHISIRAIARAVFHSSVTPVSELVQIVLDAPGLAPLRRVAFADLAGENLVGRVAVGCAHDVAFGVAELGFAHCGCKCRVSWVLISSGFHTSWICRHNPTVSQGISHVLELNVPSLPASATLAVHIKLQKAFERFVISQLALIGLVYPAVRSMISAPL